MTPEERDLLRQTNRQLLDLRRARNAGPRPIEDPVAATVARDGMTLADYMQAIFAGKRGQEIGNVDGGDLQTCRQQWESFNSDRHPALQRGVKVVKRWYNDRLPAGGAIILAGCCGCGKTHLAKAIQELYGPGVVYWNELHLIKLIQSSYGGEGGRSEGSIYQNASLARLLIYDDLGAYETDNLRWIRGIYYRLFDERLERGLATFITTNLALVDGAGEASPLEARLGPRVYSRLMGALGQTEFYVDLFDVPDYRQREF